MSLGALGCLLLLAAWPSSGLAQTPDVEFEASLSLEVGRSLDGFDGRAARIDARLRLEAATQGAPPPVVVAGMVRLPRGVEIDGRRYPRCSGRRLRERQSVDGCPEASIVGRNRTPLVEDPEGFAHPDFIFVNGGPRRLWALATIYRPALVQEPIAYELHKRGRRLEASFAVPPILRIVAGVPVALSSWPFAAGGRPWALGYATYDGRCRNRPLGFQASLTYLRPDGSTAEVTREGPVRCRRMVVEEEWEGVGRAG